MDTSVKGLNKWANAHTSFWVDALRVVFGAFLIYKGASFITNSGEFEGFAASTNNFSGGMISFHYIAIAHIMGGIMIIFGLMTRWAIIAQLPILLGAIVINFLGDMHPYNLMLASVTLLISLFFLFFGSGKHSADYIFKLQK